MLRVGDTFDDGRYTVVGQLGKGTFGRVVEMWDVVDKRPVAIKVVRAVEKCVSDLPVMSSRLQTERCAPAPAPALALAARAIAVCSALPPLRDVLPPITHCARRYAREAEIESDILRKLQRTLPDDGGGFPIVHLYRTFQSRGHYCLSFNMMGPSLYSARRCGARSMSSAAARWRRRRRRRKQRRRGPRRHRLVLLTCADRCHRVGLLPRAGARTRCSSHTPTSSRRTSCSCRRLTVAAAAAAAAAVGCRGRVALIDFGGTDVAQRHTRRSCARGVPAAEVTLGLEWGVHVDMWSMGCILAEPGRRSSSRRTTRSSTSR